LERQLGYKDDEEEEGVEEEEEEKKEEEVMVVEKIRTPFGTACKSSARRRRLQADERLLALDDAVRKELFSGERDVTDDTPAWKRIVRRTETDTQAEFFDKM
jgi:hypothetical protein